MYRDKILTATVRKPDTCIYIDKPDFKKRKRKNVIFVGGNFGLFSEV